MFFKTHAPSLKDFWQCCATYLLGETQKLFIGIPFPNLYAQPNKEGA